MPLFSFFNREPLFSSSSADRQPSSSSSLALSLSLSLRDQIRLRGMTTLSSLHRFLNGDHFCRSGARTRAANLLDGTSKLLLLLLLFFCPCGQGCAFLLQLAFFCAEHTDAHKQTHTHSFSRANSDSNFAPFSVHLKMATTLPGSLYFCTGGKSGFSHDTPDFWS